MIPLAVKEIGAEQYDIPRLGIGKDLAPAEIGIGILQTAGEDDKGRGQQCFRHLPAMSAEIHNPSSSSAYLRPGPWWGVAAGRSFLLHKGADVRGEHLRRLLAAQHVTLDGHVIAPGIAPLGVAVVVVIILAGAVHRFNLLNGLLRIQIQLLHDSAQLELGVAADENADAVGVVFQHLLTAAAQHHKALPLSSLCLEHLEGALCHIDLQGVGILSDAAGGEEVDRALVHLADDLRAVALIHHLRLNGLLIIESNAQGPGNHLGNIVAAAAVLAADGNDNLLFRMHTLLHSFL